jgi:hypothetical protein
MKEASSLKPRRKRRTSAEMSDLLEAVKAVLDGYGKDRISVRHLCYRLSSRQIIAKTGNDFDQLGKHLGNWRKAGMIPYGRFVDATRWYHGGTTFDTAAEALEDSITSYRKNLWRTQPYFVEVWVEKQAVASIVVPVADAWGIKTFPCRGFSSLTSTWEAAETFKEAIRHGKAPMIFYFGDLDKSGQDCDKTIHNHFDLHGIADQIIFKRLAILPEQIKKFNLPTRPPKRKGDPRQCVEIDTLSSAQIRRLLEDEIMKLIDPKEWNRLRAIEEAEKETLNNILYLYREELEEIA